MSAPPEFGDDAARISWQESPRGGGGDGGAGGGGSGGSSSRPGSGRSRPAGTAWLSTLLKPEHRKSGTPTTLVGLPSRDGRTSAREHSGSRGGLAAVVRRPRSPGRKQSPARERGRSSSPGRQLLSR